MSDTFLSFDDPDFARKLARVLDAEQEPLRISMRCQSLQEHLLLQRMQAQLLVEAIRRETDDG